MTGREQRPAQGGGDPPAAEIFDPDAFALRLAEARARRSRVLATQQPTGAVASAASIAARGLRGPAAVALAPAGPAPLQPELPPVAPGGARRAMGGRPALVFLGGLALGVAVAGLAVTLGGRGPALSSVAPAVPLEPPAAAPAPTAASSPAVPAAFGPLAGPAAPARLAAVGVPDRASPVAVLRPQPRPDGFSAPVPQVTRAARDRRATPAAAPARAGPPNLPRLIGGLLRQLATNRKVAVPPGDRDD